MHLYKGSELNISTVKPISNKIYTKLFVKLRQHNEVLVFSYANKGANESGSCIQMRNESCQVTGYQMDVFTISRPHEVDFASVVLLDEERIAIGANGRFAHGLHKDPFVCKVRNSIGQFKEYNMNCGHLFNVSGMIHLKGSEFSLKCVKRDLSYYFNVRELPNKMIWERIKESIV